MLAFYFNDLSSETGTGRVNSHIERWEKVRWRTKRKIREIQKTGNVGNLYQQKNKEKAGNTCQASAKREIEITFHIKGPSLNYSKEENQFQVAERVDEV